MGGGSEIGCTICQLVQGRFSLCTYTVCVCMCEYFPFDNEASGLFIESLSQFYSLYLLPPRTYQQIWLIYSL